MVSVNISSTSAYCAFMPVAQINSLAPFSKFRGASCTLSDKRPSVFPCWRVFSALVLILARSRTVFFPIAICACKFFMAICARFNLGSIAPTFLRTKLRGVCSICMRNKLISAYKALLFDSGLTIWARKCGVCFHAHIITLSPHYVDVAVRRWQEFTGKTAILESTGEEFPHD